MQTTWGELWTIKNLKVSDIKSTSFPGVTEGEILSWETDLWAHMRSGLGGGWPASGTVRKTWLYTFAVTQVGLYHHHYILLEFKQEWLIPNGGHDGRHPSGSGDQVVLVYSSNGNELQDTGCLGATHWKAFSKAWFALLAWPLDCGWNVRRETRCGSPHDAESVLKLGRELRTPDYSL